MFNDDDHDFLFDLDDFTKTDHEQHLYQRYFVKKKE